MIRNRHVVFTLCALLPVFSCAQQPLPTQASASVEGAVSDLASFVWLPKWVLAGSRAQVSAGFENWGTDLATGAVATLDIVGGSNAVGSTHEGTPCTVSKIRGGQRLTCTLSELSSGWVDAWFDAPSRGSVTVKSSVTSGNADPDLANNVSVSTTAVASATDANLMMARVKRPKFGFLVGREVGLVFPVANEGPGTARGVVLRISVTGPARVLGGEGREGQPCTVVSGTELSCALGDAPAGEWLYSPFARLFLDAEGEVVITATVSSATRDPVSADNTTQRAFRVYQPTYADLSVSVTDAPDPVHAGSELTYHVTVANTGPDAATGAYFYAYMQEGVRIARVAFEGAECSWDEAGLWCWTSLAGGAALTGTVVVVPSMGGTIATRFETYNALAWRELDENYDNNGASVETSVRGPQDPVVTQAWHEKVPVDTMAYDDCNGRWVWLMGDMHISYHTVYHRSSGRSQVEWVNNFAGVSGGALETGEEYQAGGTWRGLERWEQWYPQSFTYGSRFQLLTLSGEPNLNVHVVSRVTFDADWVPKTVVEHVRYECR